MFKLLFNKRRYSRGIKMLAEIAYVRIGLVSFKLQAETDYTAHITIGIWDHDNNEYCLIIPDDKIDSVCERLQEAKRNKECNTRATANFNKRAD